VKKTLSILLILCLMLTLIVGVSGCSNTKKPVRKATEEQATEEQATEEQATETDNNSDVGYVTFVDTLGETVRIKKNPQRVVGLYNSFINVWYEAGGEVIGRTSSTSQLTKKALDAEVCGSFGSPNIEKIISLNPDLVILSTNIDGQKNIIPLLKENKIPYMAVSYNNVDEYLDILKLFTDLNGRPDLYESIGRKVKNDVNAIIAKVPKENNPSVLLLFGSSRSVRVKLPNSFVGAMLEDLGTTNIAYDANLTDDEMQIFSMEKVLERDPDFIFVQTMGSDIDKIKARIAEDIESNPAWETLTAVKEGRYILLPKDLYLYKPNQRYGEAYEGLAKILYPEVFK